MHYNIIPEQKKYLTSENAIKIWISNNLWPSVLVWGISSCLVCFSWWPFYFSFLTGHSHCHHHRPPWSLHHFQIPLKHWDKIITYTISISSSVCDAKDHFIGYCNLSTTALDGKCSTVGMFTGKITLDIVTIIYFTEVQVPLDLSATCLTCQRKNMIQNNILFNSTVIVIFWFKIITI